jgi:hypothetical protein
MRSASQTALQDIELARTSQEVTKRFDVLKAFGAYLVRWKVTMLRVIPLSAQFGMMVALPARSLVRNAALLSEGIASNLQIPYRLHAHWMEDPSQAPAISPGRSFFTRDNRHSPPVTRSLCASLCESGSLPTRALCSGRFAPLP